MSGNPEIEIDDVPKGLSGTFWLASSTGVKIAAVRKEGRSVAESRAAANLDDILAANVGRNIEVGVIGGDERFARSESGKLLSANGTLIVLQTPSGGLALPKEKISMISAPNGDLLYTLSSKTEKTVLVIDANASRPGKILLLNVERGFEWQPAYAVDLELGNKITIEAKATIGDDLTAISNAEVRLLSGAPVSDGPIEPLLGGEFPGLDNMQAGGLIPSNVPYITYDPTDNSIITQDRNGQITKNSMPILGKGVQNEDLFYYSVPSLSLSKGGRAMVMLFENEASYEDVYAAFLSDPVQNDAYSGPQSDAVSVEHNIEFKNTTDQPFIAAGAILSRNGDLLGQSYLSYTAKGAKATVSLGTAPDVQVSSTESETSRERGSLRLPNKASYDLVSLEGKVLIDNFKSEAITLRVLKGIAGTVDSAVGANIDKTAPSPEEINAGARITWNLKLRPGEMRTLTYSYKVYLKSGA